MNLKELQARQYSVKDGIQDYKNVKTGWRNNNMKIFIDENFLLKTNTAMKIYHEYGKNMPIVDYHCHISPQEIAENKSFDNITEVWLKHDHYKWRLMRSNGIPEFYITGEATDREKFGKWVETIEKAIGNPLFHWSHLEMQRYFGFNKPLTRETAQEAWDHCNKKLKKMKAIDFISQSNVEYICTTDDPVDDLKWHEKIRLDDEIEVKVLPTFRPDKALDIENENYTEYLKKLEECSGVSIKSFNHWKKAMVSRIEYFWLRGCVISDHGLNTIMFNEADDSEIEKIFIKRLSGETLYKSEALMFKTSALLFCAEEYCKRNWTMQLHYGVVRNTNKKMFEILGPDSGYDCIGDNIITTNLINVLNSLEYKNALPKTILYSLNPNDNASIDTVIGCFQGHEKPSKIQHGTAWWVNDHKIEIKKQLTSLASQGMLANSVGMLTDSRSFLSYVRHEYYRRIVCDYVGELVENGEYPENEIALKEIIEGIFYKNAINYFEF